MANSVIKRDLTLRYKGILSASDNLDDIQSMGMYQIRGSGTTPINTPKTPWGTE